MTRFYVNQNAQTNGDHEAHKDGCSYMPLTHNRLYLGEFSGCAAAVSAARQHYPQSNGCFYCSRSCHTG